MTAHADQNRCRATAADSRSADTADSTAILEREKRAGRTVIIGSLGRMGAMLVARAQAAGLDVVGVDVPLAPEKLSEFCAGADMAVLCVPAAVFGEVAAAVCPHLPARAVLADITSVKEQPMRQMERIWPGPVVGTHPLFGPSPEAEADLPVALTAGHNADPEHLALVEAFFTKIGCRTFMTTAEKHDKAMARIQNMNFITSLAYFSLLAGQDDLLPFLTPSFRRRHHAARKMLTEDARLFAGLFEANAHSHEAVRQYRQMLNLAAAGDIDLLCQRAAWWWPEECGQDGLTEA
ncbi:prephenate dehydrogenase/arogenate dehydrogenase family protein [Desulfovibrio sp.]|uniref:prephenate dehydrogenase/arogenate dehydrogenase family protein n=1 Tax=Desulfovibrio sp. TaxID=885 RepID=UPI0025C4514C|nr:prephenate dehydrogenase/arogenate dehydrogenase family protein [Desulfovibrio sp.]